MSPREEMLARVRSANTATQPGQGARADPDVARGYRGTGEHAPGSPAVLDLFEERLVDYKATVRRCGQAGLRAAVADALTATVARGGRVVLPPALPLEWAPAGTPDDGSLTATELDGFAAVVTASRAACAETGTIALDGAPDQGRRAITLVPDVHVCVVRADQVVQTVPDLIGRV